MAHLRYPSGNHAPGLRGCRCSGRLPRALWERLGGFDESYSQYGEEIDLSVRAVVTCAGYQHLGGVSSGTGPPATSDCTAERWSLTAATCRRGGDGSTSPGSPARLVRGGHSSAGVVSGGPVTAITVVCY